MAMTESEQDFLSGLLAKKKERSNYVEISPELESRRAEIMSSPEIPKDMPPYPPTRVKKGEVITKEQIKPVQDPIDLVGQITPKETQVQQLSEPVQELPISEPIRQPAEAPKPEEATDWRAWLTLLTPLATGALTGQMDAGGRYGAKAIEQEVARRDALDKGAIEQQRSLELMLAKVKAKEEAKSAGKPLTKSNFLEVDENGVNKYVKADEYAGQPMISKSLSGLTFEQRKELESLKASLKKGKGEDLAKKEKDVNPIRQQYLKQSQDTIDIQNSLSSLVELANSPQTGPRDVGIVFRWMKTFDPGSVVREGEQATANNSGSIPENVRNFYNRIVGGKQKIDHAVIGDMVSAAKRNYEGALISQKNTDKYFNNITARSGLPSVTMNFIDPKQMSMRKVIKEIDSAKKEGKVIEQNGSFFKYDPSVGDFVEVKK